MKQDYVYSHRLEILEKRLGHDFLVSRDKGDRCWKLGLGLGKWLPTNGTDERSDHFESESAYGDSLIFCYIYNNFDKYVYQKVSMVEWYNQRLPYAGPGFDSRSIQLIFFALFSPGHQ